MGLIPPGGARDDQRERHEGSLETLGPFDAHVSTPWQGAGEVTEQPAVVPFSARKGSCT